MKCNCLIVGIILLICGSITLICTGVLVYKPFNYGTDFVSTQCSIQHINKGTVERGCGDGCSVTVDCLAFQVSYNDPRNTVNILELFNQTGILGYLSPDEASIKEYGWCYPDDEYPSCHVIGECTFWCLFNPGKNREVIEHPKFTRPGAINALFWPVLVVGVSITLIVVSIFVHD